MERIAHRELRNNSSEILRRVASGESFEVTNHGAVVAVIRPPETTVPLRVVKAATRRGRWSDLEPAESGGPPMQEILDALREDRV